MKTFLRILLILTIVLNIFYFIPAINVFISITQYPEEWQAGIDMNSTITWFIVITIGYGYLFLQSFLAFLGLLFGFKRRRAAFWLLLLPGFIGIVFSLIWLLLFINFDAEWPSSWRVVTILIISPVIGYFTGRYIRKKIIPKTKKSPPVAGSSNL